MPVEGAEHPQKAQHGQGRVLYRDRVGQRGREEGRECRLLGRQHAVAPQLVGAPPRVGLAARALALAAGRARGAVARLPILHGVVFRYRSVVDGVGLDPDAGVAQGRLRVRVRLRLVVAGGGAVLPHRLVHRHVVRQDLIVQQELQLVPRGALANHHGRLESTHTFLTLP